MSPSIRIEPEFRERNQRLGLILVLLGGMGILFCGITEAGGFIPIFSISWPVRKHLWIGLSLGFLGAGFWIQGKNSTTAWRPTVPGRRFDSARLYSREGCHLCEEAVQLLIRYREYLPKLEVIDIDDPIWENYRKEFDTSIPVLECDGRIYFKGTISEVLLQRLIEGTPPMET